MAGPMDPGEERPNAVDAKEGEVRRIHDLVAFAALPATQAGREPAGMVECFAVALVRMPRYLPHSTS